jgi:hypothetical protein
MENINQNKGLILLANPCGQNVSQADRLAVFKLQAAALSVVLAA